MIFLFQEVIMDKERICVSLDKKVRARAYECGNYDGYATLTSYLTSLINKDFKEKEEKLRRQNNGILYSDMI